MNENAQYVQDTFPGGLESYVNDLYSRAQAGAENDIDNRVIAEIQRLGGQVDYARLNSTTATGTNGSNTNNSGQNANNGGQVILANTTTTLPINETTLRDEYGNTMVSQSGFPAVNAGLLDNISNGANSIWEKVTAPLKTMFEAFASAATGLKMLVEKFVSLGLWWLPIFFVGYFAISLLKFRAGGKYASIGGRK